MKDHDRIRRAVDRLADSLTELGYTDRVSIKPDIQMLLSPGEATVRDAPHVRALGFTPELAELLAEAVEQLIIRRAVQGARPEMASAIDGAFADIDRADLARAVLSETAPENHTAVTRALNAVFGDAAEQEAEDDK